MNGTQLYWHSPSTGKLLQHKENIQPFLYKRPECLNEKLGHNGGFVTHPACVELGQISDFEDYLTILGKTGPS